MNRPSVCTPYVDPRDGVEYRVMAFRNLSRKEAGEVVRTFLSVRGDVGLGRHRTQVIETRIGAAVEAPPAPTGLGPWGDFAALAPVFHGEIFSVEIRDPLMI